MFSISRSFFGHFPTIPDYFTISEGYRRLTEISEDYRRLTKMSEDYRRCPQTTEDFQEEIRKFLTLFLSLSYSHGKYSRLVPRLPRILMGMGRKKESASFYSPFEHRSSRANNNSDARHVLQEVSVDSSAQIQPATTSNTAVTIDTCTSRCMAGAVAGLFTGVTFNNSPVNILINFQSNVNPQSGRFL